MTQPSSEHVRTNSSPAERPMWPGLMMAALVAGSVAGVNVTITPRSLTVLGLLVAVPFVAATASTVLGTIAAGVIGVSAAALMGDYDHATWHRDLLVVICGIVAATLVAAGNAGIKTRRARQLQRSRAVAEVVQQTLLRPLPTQIAGVRIAAHYASATRGAQVGGDIYEALETPYGVRVFLGDVRGKGLPALHLANTALGAFRERAHEARDLRELATQLDVSVARNADIEEFVTAALVQIGDTGAQIVNCGHPAPLLLTGHDVAAVEPERTSLPLGLGVTPITTAVPLDAGDRLLLYTDGVSDARRRGKYFDVATEVAALHDRDPDALIIRLQRRLVKFTRRRLDDDVAILLLERVREGRSGSRRQPLELHEGPHATLV
jgi:hypothetical protein